MAEDDWERRRIKGGERIRNARRARKLTQLELAAALDVDQSTISKYESGAMAPETDKRQLLEQVLRLQGGELLAIYEPEAFSASQSEQLLVEVRDEQRRTNSLLERLVEIWSKGR